MSIVAMISIVYGTVSCLWSSFVCFRLQRTQKASAFSILSLMFLVCPLNLYTWNMDVFLDIIYKIRDQELFNLSDFAIVEKSSLIICRITYFLQIFALSSTSWLFCLLLIDQVLKLYLSDMKYHKKPIYMTYVSIVIIIVAFFSNIHVLLFAGKTKFSEREMKQMNASGNIVSFQCYDSNYFNHSVYNKIVTSFLIEVIPIAIVLFCSILIFFKLRIKKSLSASIDPESVRRRHRYSISFLIMSCIYFTCTMPSMFCFSFFFMDIIMLPNSDLLLSALNLIHFLFYSCLPTIFFLTNQVFRKEVKRVIPHSGSESLRNNSTAHGLTNRTI
jgi:hypothetical protein